MASIIEYPDSDCFVGPARISHDNGATWHEAGAECRACVLRQDGPVVRVTSVDGAAGAITIVALTLNEAAIARRYPQP